MYSGLSSPTNTLVGSRLGKTSAAENSLERLSYHHSPDTGTISPCPSDRSSRAVSTCGTCLASSFSPSGELSMNF